MKKATKKILGLYITSIFIFGGVVYADNNSSSDVSSVIDNVQLNLPDFSGIYNKVGKSVVNVSILQNISNSRYRSLNVSSQQQKGLGSGFIISNDGYILTNAHVIDKADSVTVRLSDRREFKAKIIGSDPITDVAVLKINATNLAPVRIGDPNKLKSGNWVVAIGSPFGLENTITHGIVSAMSRNLPDENALPFIQTDVPINPGNSGGPLINLRGEVVGINSQIYSRSGGYMGISFAIPIDYAMRVAEQIKSTGRAVRGRLGITIQPVTNEIASSFGLNAARGVLVNGVDDKSPASLAGIQIGDVILSIDKQQITDGLSLPALISNLGPNKTIKIEIWRNGQVLNLTATTASSDVRIANNFTNNNVNSNKNNGLIERLGIAVTALKPEQIRAIGVKITGGIVVKQSSDIAEYYGLQVGDVILGIANTPITSVNQLQQIISNAKRGQSIVFRVLRINNSSIQTMFIAIPVLN